MIKKHVNIKPNACLLYINIYFKIIVVRKNPNCVCTERECVCITTKLGKHLTKKNNTFYRIMSNLIKTQTQLHRNKIEYKITRKIIKIRLRIIANFWRGHIICHRMGWPNSNIWDFGDWVYVCGILNVYKCFANNLCKKGGIVVCVCWLFAWLNG